MRILHIVESLAAGGVETTFLHVLRAWQASGRGAGRIGTPGLVHDVLAFAGGVLESEYRDTARHVTITGLQADIERVVVDGHYDVAHVIFERCADRVLPTLFTRTSTRVAYGKNYDFSGQGRSTEGFVMHADDAMVAACDGVTFTTEALAAAYQTEDAARSRILGKGADVRPLLALPPPGPHTPNRILVIANPTPRKRLGDLLTALPRIRARVPDAHVRVLGQGDPAEERRLRAMADEAGLASSFVLAGASRHIADELRGCRIVALSSGNEGVPTALLEGMAAERPVVTTDAGHVRSILDDGVEGFIVPVGDIDGMAERIVHLLTHRATAATMGRSGRTRAAAHSVEVIAARLSELLIEIGTAH